MCCGRLFVIMVGGDGGYICRLTRSSRAASSRGAVDDWSRGRARREVLFVDSQESQRCEGSGGGCLEGGLSKAAPLLCRNPGLLLSGSTSSTKRITWRIQRAGAPSASPSSLRFSASSARRSRCGLCASSCMTCTVGDALLLTRFAVLSYSHDLTLFACSQLTQTMNAF